MNLSKIHHIAIIVSDYEAARDFYVNRLGFSVIRENYRSERKDWKLDLRVNELDVIENNTTAEKLYQKLGFQYVQTKTLYYDVVGKMTFKLYELVL